jgi:hypothetical protein
VLGGGLAAMAGLPAAAAAGVSAAAAGTTDPGAWPDADRLPVGKFGLRNYDSEPAQLGERDTRFTRDEQLLMLTAWTCARSPLILGNDLRRLDDWTLRLLTNPEVLALLRVAGAREWHSVAEGHRFVCNGPQGTWAAWLNTGDTPWQAPLPARLPDASRDCWARDERGGGSRAGSSHRCPPAVASP